MPHSEQIPVAEAADLLGESRWTTQRRIRSGQLTAHKVAGVYLLDRADVIALLNTKEVAS